ncbi:MAG: hypothetical protein WB511_01340 [Nitrososphaeraceae archaeon]
MTQLNAKLTLKSTQQKIMILIIIINVAIIPPLDVPGNISPYETMVTDKYRWRISLNEFKLNKTNVIEFLIYWKNMKLNLQQHR